MSKLNIEKVLEKCPELSGIALDGCTDYKTIEATLLGARIKPTNKLIWDVINALQDDGLEDPVELDFYE